MHKDRKRNITLENGGAIGRTPGNRRKIKDTPKYKNLTL